jgi:acyl-CoA thioester hydrolase
MKIDFIGETKVRVRYGETDQMGVAYYGNYASYFEVGRVETLRNIGLSYREIEENGIMLPVSEFNVKYLNPVKYDDVITIKTKLSSVLGARLTFEYDMFNSNNVLCAQGYTVLVFIDKDSRRPVKAPNYFLEKLKKYESA